MVQKFQISKVSRRRGFPLLEPASLQRLRVETWHESIVRLASIEDEQGTPPGVEKAWKGSESVEFAVSPQAWVNARSTRLSDYLQNAVSDVGRQRYDLGVQIPSDATLLAFEALLPGSLDVYASGLHGYPLWQILAGDADACETFLGCAIVQPPNEAFPSFQARAQTVLDAALSPERRIQLNSLPALRGAADGMHPIYLSHLEQRILPWDACQVGFEEEVTIAAEVLCAIALWHQALQRKDPDLFRMEWLVVGLCNGVVAWHFTESVQQYLLKFVMQTAKALDKTLQARMPTLPSFADRWSEKFDGRALATLYEEDPGQLVPLHKPDDKST